MASSKPKKGQPRNRELVPGTGIMRFSRARMYAKKAVHIKKKFLKKVKAPKTKKEVYKIKKVTGEKNGGERKVMLKKPPSLLTSERIRPRKLHKAHKPYKKHERYLRKSLTPGTVVIILVGRHKGKRAVFLKQLDSGLLLLTGPHRVNGFPLRRMNQIYVIATKTKVDLTGVDVPENLNDKYFSRPKKVNKKTSEPDIFSSKKQEYVVSEQRKKDQKLVDGLVLGAIKKRPDKRTMIKYLRNSFYLRKNEFPHQMVF